MKDSSKCNLGRKRGNKERNGAAPNCLSHSSTTLCREGILTWGRQKRHCKGNVSKHRSQGGNTNPGSARERSRVVVHVVGALHLANSKYARISVERERSPISNGLTTVATGP